MSKISIFFDIFFALGWLVLFVVYLLNVFEPTKITIAIAMFFTILYFVSSAINNLKENKL